MKMIFVVMSLLILTACSARTYIQEGVDIGNESTYAILVTRNDPNDTAAKFGSHTYITRVNGENLHSFFKQPAWPERAFLNKGINSFQIHHKKAFSFVNYCLWVDAKLGEVYFIRKKEQGYSVSFWVESQSNGEIVGGICGSEPKI